MPESFRLELAHALLARTLFPDAPLKWMPPTRHMTGDVFQGYLLDGFFNLVGSLTDQDILLVGMMTEAVVTPWLSDRDLALQNVRYVQRAAGGLAEDFVPRRTGFIATRARHVLGEAVDLLERIVGSEGGLLTAIEHGTFGGMKRPADGGRGLDGVVERAEDYVNPVERDPGRRPRMSDAPASTTGPARLPDGLPPVVRPYGDTTGDGMVQMSFTLPLPAASGPRARPSSWRGRWAWTRRWSSTPSRSATASRSSSSTARSATSSTWPRSRWWSGSTRC